MLRTALAVAAAAAVTATAGSVALGHDNDGPRPLKPDAKWTTVFKATAPVSFPAPELALGVPEASPSGSKPNGMTNQPSQAGRG